MNTHNKKLNKKIAQIGIDAIKNILILSDLSEPSHKNPEKKAEEFSPNFEHRYFLLADKQTPLMFDQTLSVICKKIKAPLGLVKAYLLNKASGFDDDLVYYILLSVKHEIYDLEAIGSAYQERFKTPFDINQAIFFKRFYEGIFKIDGVLSLLTNHFSACDDEDELNSYSVLATLEALIAMVVEIESTGVSGKADTKL